MLMPRNVAERSDTLAPIDEVFRERGFKGASLSLIGRATGLNKGSLYNFFPGGKEEMAQTVLSEIGGWFDTHIFTPLQQASRPEDAIATMFDSVEMYFRSGRRVCLVGAFALGDSRDRFSREVQSYFSRWVEALDAALRRAQHNSDSARALAEEVVAGIQGALVLARALDEPQVFSRALARLRARSGLP